MAVIYRSYKYRIYPTKEQEKLIQKTFGCVRYVYNYFLTRRIELYNNEKINTTFYKQNKELTELKKENVWLKEPDKNALQNALINLDYAYDRFFHGLKTGKKVGYPKYKKKKASKQVYQTNNNNGNSIGIKENKVRLPKLKFIKAKISRDIPNDAIIKSASVIQTADGKYYVNINFEMDIDINPIKTIVPSRVIGLDYSSPHFYVDSNGYTADMPHYYRTSQDKLSKNARKLSHMTKDGKNYNKQKIKIAKINSKIANQRLDWQHKLANKIVNDNDVVCLEDINLVELSQQLSLGKSTFDNGFGQFRDILRYKMNTSGKHVVKIDKWFPSSKKCHVCGNVNESLTINDRVWVCPTCNTKLDRDVNAAINIKEEGLNVLFFN